MARIVQRSGTPHLLAANKADGAAVDRDLGHLWALGLGEPHPVSALHGRNIGDVLDLIVGLLPPDEGPPAVSDLPTIAILGRPNVGKSTLLNRLAGEERVLVSPEPGTTRDPIDTVIELDGARYRVVDTAGIRRASRIQGMAETFSVERARWVLEQTDLTLLVIDGTQGVTHQEQRLAEEIAASGSALIILLNKWDIADAEQKERTVEDVGDRLAFVAWAPVLRIAARTGAECNASVRRSRECSQPASCVSPPLAPTDASLAGRRRTRHRLAAGDAGASSMPFRWGPDHRRSSSSCAAARSHRTTSVSSKVGFASTTRSLAHRYAWSPDEGKRGSPGEWRDRFAAEAERARLGGPEKYRERLPEQGKLPVRQRVDLLCDPGSFVEDGLLANALGTEMGADGVVTGRGIVDGRPAVVIANDPTVKAGSWGARPWRRWSAPSRPPTTSVSRVLFDRLGRCSHHRPGRSVSRGVAVRDASSTTRCGCQGGCSSDLLPLRPVGGGRCLHPGVLRRRDHGGGQCIDVPRIAAHGRDGHRRAHHARGHGRSPHALLGERVWRRSHGKRWGSNCVGRTYFSYMPADHASAPPLYDFEEAEAIDPGAVLPDDARHGYDMHDFMRGLFDEGSILEIKELFAPEVITALARLGGRPVGVVASQPDHLGGVLFVDSADKATRFIWLCDAFNLPLVFLADVPGFMIGTEVERQGIIRAGAKMLSAIAEATVPRISVIVRKAYGAGLYAFSGPGFKPDATIALPSAEIAVMGPEAAVNAVFYNAIHEIADAEERKRFIAERREEYERDVDLLRLASDLVIDAVVEPSRLREELITHVSPMPRTRTGSSRTGVTASLRYDRARHHPRPHRIPPRHHRCGDLPRRSCGAGRGVGGGAPRRARHQASGIRHQASGRVQIITRERPPVGQGPHVAEEAGDGAPAGKKRPGWPDLNRRPITTAPSEARHHGGWRRARRGADAARRSPAGRVRNSCVGLAGFEPATS